MLRRLASRGRRALPFRWLQKRQERNRRAGEEFVADNDPPDFIPVDWTTTPSDTNDRMLGQLVNAVLDCRDVSKPDVVCFGLPFDGAVIGRAGAVKGPTAIRASARTLKAYRFGSGEV